MDTSSNSAKAFDSLRDENSAREAKLKLVAKNLIYLQGEEASVYMQINHHGIS